MEFVHKSVLFDEAIKALDLNKNKIIVDGTAGGGGHSGEIAKTAKRVISIDQDPDAIEVLNERLGNKENVTIVHDNYSNIKNIVSNLNIDKIDGLLLDLGVSSFQLDTAERGFSFHKDAPLDMRMSKSGLSAYDVVNNYDEAKLSKIFKIYGEEKNANRIARKIVEQRSIKPIETTLELANLIDLATPYKDKRSGGHPAKKVFQAIRIEVNNELEELEQALKTCLKLLNVDGRMCVISFHSLEDRIVKNIFKEVSEIDPFLKGLPNIDKNLLPDYEIITNKPILPSEDEINYNKRSKSAKLRIIKRIK